MDEVRDGDAGEADGFAGAVGCDEGGELGCEQGGVRGGEGACVGVLEDVSFDGVGEFEGDADAGERVVIGEAVEVGGEEVGVFGGGGLVAFVVEGAAGGGEFGAPGGAEVVSCGVEDCDEDLYNPLGFGGRGARALVIVVFGVGEGGADEEGPRQVAD